MYSLILPCLVALATSAGLTVGVRQMAMRCNVMDHPDGARKLHPKATPLWGGVAVFLALLLGVAVAGPGALVSADGHLALTAVVLVVAGGFCALGAVDDCHVLKSRPKLLFQIIALLSLVALGYHFDRVNLLDHSVALGWLEYPVTVIWLLACINAFNLLDGSDGLATTVGLAASLPIAVVALAMGHRDVAVMAAVLAGATAGFLIHNRPPARIFLGDSGSMVIGLVVGILSAEAAVTPEGDMVVVFPMVLMCLPLLDSLLALLRRKLTGRPFDTPDRQHIHHRFLDRGMGPWQVLAAITGLFLITGAAATAAVLSGYGIIGWAAVVALVVGLVRARWFGHHEWKLASSVIQHWRSRFGESIQTRFARRTRPNEPSENHEREEKESSRRNAA